MVSYITEENKRRKRRRIVLMKQYFESALLASFPCTSGAPIEVRKEWLLMLA
jgi:hypothetical protein